MDDISRESSPAESGAAPVSERQKGPEELGRFEQGLVEDEHRREIRARRQRRVVVPE